MPAHHLAQINIARLRSPLDHPDTAGFVSQLTAVNHLAEQSPGFIWRHREATGLDFNSDPLTVVNISVWQSVEALHAFTYSAQQHLDAFRRRLGWFHKMDAPHYCLWWIPAGHLPTVIEARTRLDLYRTSGPTPASFGFSRTFRAPA